MEPCAAVSRGWHEITYYKEWRWLLGGNRPVCWGREECQEHREKQKDQLEGNNHYIVVVMEVVGYCWILDIY